MPNSDDPALLAQVRDLEDQYVERKLEGAGGKVFKKTLIAFANSVPPGRSATLLVGVGDSGAIVGVANPDGLQKTLRNIAENECFPPIAIDLATFVVDEKHIVAAIVKDSAMRPHFAGAAFVRRGSESIEATTEIYRSLLLAQDEKRRYILDRPHATWTVELLNKSPGAALPLFDTRARSCLDCKVEEVSAFFVRLRDTNGRGFTELLQDVHISYDDEKHRPRLIIWPVGRL